ncbi:hypothetical protein ANRL4_03445 [Anaerolineae bacterium]|nr:hypothetical protein ANRL4_03445 [Anaerolineae bacterium]
MNRQQIARDTLAALQTGSYLTAHGQQVEIGAQASRCVEQTRCYSPESLSQIQGQVLASPLAFAYTTFEVANETTLEGCAHLVTEGGYERVGVLNFASARHPGGGFLDGAQAQEESLARSSGLYPSLIACPDYYRVNRQTRTALYTDWMIYSPACPVFRTDQGGWLETPYRVDFLTSPAPNAGAIRQNEPERVGDIEPTLHARASKVLALAASQGCEVLVLGAWGCGVFANDPQVVAAVFGTALHATGAFWRRFQKVRFSVWDRSSAQATFKAFEAVFGGPS